MFQFIHLIQYSLATFNNMLSSLPFCIRYLVHAVLAFCFPFYSMYLGCMMFINRIQSIAYPFYRIAMLLTRIFTFFVTLPVRIITSIVTQSQALLKNLLVLLISAGVIIGLTVLFLDEYQVNYLKSYVQNTTDLILKKTSMIY